MLEVYDDAYFMRQAIAQAKLAAREGEIPVGAIVVSGGRIIARGHNQTERLNDVTAHAEIIALTAAANHLGDKYLHDCTLYVTLEPCPMCAGALGWAQATRIVYGASDDKRGFMRFGRELLHPKTILEYGILHEECGQLMTEFFRKRR
ncbi:nucleoside deaminase [Lewinella sp. W8]|uniref:nucleoside deaminase n=1 Tax=Lewinella sp. W8 TaxID=2528208 RepID=UPI00106757C9|nr:nucleoside deaminase [Lewinella sp. W8]MTB49505.1 nucleoside deaminase [Lewinella sp. W8]